MNQSFLKMLRFEWKANFTIWIFSFIIAFSVILMFFYTRTQNSNPPVLNGAYFSIFIILTYLFTLYSYQESTTSQSMQMYHLISVSRNVKFFSKQFITLLAFPLLLITGTFFLIIIINLFSPGEQDVIFIPPNENIFIVFLGWILGQSISTLLAIVFKKNKIVYALLTYFVSQIVLGIVVLLLQFVLKPIGIMESFNFPDGIFFWKIMGASVTIALSALLYGISYHLFFRRQL